MQVCGLLKPDAAGAAPILVGHELSSDLRALRLVHGRVIDTAVLFPQQSLESLVRTKPTAHAVFDGSSLF